MSIQKVIKRDGTLVSFDKQKISTAIKSAMKYGSGIYLPDIADEIADSIYEQTLFNRKSENISIREIEKLVFEKLIEKEQYLTAREYESYRSIREYQRKQGTIDDNIEGIVNGINEAVIRENSNKNSFIASTQRDLLAGELSKDYCIRNILPQNIYDAHYKGIIHFHDLDYFIERVHNCCLVNLKDMLTNGTVINGRMIEPPKSFRTACTVATQIVQQIANGQYGGQTISISHLAPFVRVSKDKIRKEIQKDHEDMGISLSKQQLNSLTRDQLKREIEQGIQTIQYQINTFMTSNGQAPFLTIFMYISEEPEYEEETVLLIEEMLRQRYLGMKNEVGAYTSPAFPKLIYVLEENNIYEDSQYYHLTQQAVKCAAKRMMPDFISAKVMKEQYDGQVIPPMGCRSFLSSWKDEQGNYKLYGRFNAGVVTINLPDAALTAKAHAEHESEETLLNTFWSILNERLDLCKEALLLRHSRILEASSDISPIHWQHGGLARLEKHASIKHLMYGGYSTLSLGYIGLYETVYALIGKSHITEKGKKLGLQIIQHLADKCAEWKKETNIGFALYGTPAESTTDRFARLLRKRFGVIPNITDKDYLINSYHVDIKEKINAYDKIEFESMFQNISSGGCISYVELPNMEGNLEALMDFTKFIYENIKYAEFNTKSDYCQVCGFDGEILLDENLKWYCPKCGNRDQDKMNVIRRTCGYLGEHFWNIGRTSDIANRRLHMDNIEYEIPEETKA